MYSSLPLSIVLRKSFHSTLLLAFCGIVFLAGCGGGGKPASVKGQVTFVGATVENGSIRFDPMEDTVSDPAAAKITSGQYEIPSSAGLKAGKFRVTITASESMGRKMDPEAGEEVEVLREIIPQKYNINSELTADLTPGENQQDFALTP
jgi:hypothetical protein